MASENFPSSFDTSSDDFKQLPVLDKIWFRCKQQPLVPIGCLATCVAVGLAARGVKTGDRVSAQKWFRWRVGLQGLTLVALVGGSYLYDAVKISQQGEDPAREKAKLRESLWIRELERRDEEIQLRKQRAALARKAKLDAQENSEN
ncbi:hypothetical protein PACTADRAFT_69312 [Pachysolen tannophilus NRRL Y-2460]|uniref:Respiratory supercomplex factor 1, mitochondrial n=1 Tax=Pachysolen tannophilus NRRL Y-2460 TaxID=669874 RepID=A0A1E4TRZ0_PACTA|nr:hypothetical protein PACTADRAFT_69312 [Pachysolen tannophilus NRRL Y-2460]